MFNDAYFHKGLRDIAAISAGHPFRGAIDDLPPGNIGVIQMRNVGDNGIDWQSLTFVELPSKRMPAILAPGDVIFTTRGTRNVALALSVVPAPVVCSPHFFVLRVKDLVRMNPGFLAWQLNQRPAQEHFQREATGSYILNITRAAIEGLTIIVPPMERQLQILTFDQDARAERALLTKLIENRNQQIEAIAMRLHQSKKGSSI